jgi:hypothetical protein
MNFELLNHRAEVAKLAKVVTNAYKKPMYAVDINHYGISECFSDCENNTIYRSTIFELANDTFISQDQELDHTHYPNAPYGSIWDY